MAKIISFTKSMDQARRHALDNFVDDDSLLDFSRSEGTHTQASTNTPPQSFRSPPPNSACASDWSNQELADLYRAYSLIQAAQPGLECDRGVSDEGDPWFLIGDDTGDVLVHVCRINGTYILDSIALPKALRGKNFNALIDNFLTTVAGEKSQDTEDMRGPANVVQLARGGTVCLHPSVMIAALIWTLLINADELTLPPSNGSTQKGLDQGQDRNQDSTLLDNDEDGGVSSIPAQTAFSGNLMKSEKIYKVADDLNLKAMTAQVAQKDEKQLHVSAYSYALTTVAIAAGFYASAEATDTFWKTTKLFADTPLSFGEVEVRDGQDKLTSLDNLSDALNLLSSVVDLVVFESYENYEIASRNGDSDNTDALTAAPVDTMSVSIGQQMLSVASEMFRDLAEASESRAADAANTIIKSGFDVEAGSAMYADAAIFLDGKGLGDTTSEGYFASILDAYTSRDTDVVHYDVASFEEGLGKFGGELQKYSEIFENASGIDNYHLTSSAMPESEDTFNGSPSFNTFDAAARQFIDEKIASGDIEMLVFENEIIFVDKATFSESGTAVSWQLEDGGVISMIGLPNEMGEFLVT